MTQLSAEELTLTYETNTIIDGINLNIPKGKVTIIIGRTVVENRRFFMP